jgi:effector-binding domain-containing protein
MKTLKTILYVFAILLVLYIVLCFTGQKKMEATKSLKMKASAASIWEEISDFNKWKTWSPWYAMDTATKQTFTGEPGTVGHSMSWISDVTGTGTQTISALEPNKMLETTLKFAQWDGTSSAKFLLDEGTDSTNVTWTMDGGEIPFLFRGMMVIMGGTKMLEKDYETGLASLKSIVEAKPTVPALEIELTDIPETFYVGKKFHINVKDITGDLYNKTYQEIFQVIGGPEKMTGPVFAVSHNFNDQTMEMDLEIAIPVASAMSTPEGFSSTSIPAGKAVKHIYHGAYEAMAPVWNQLMAEVSVNHKVRFSPYEVYVDDPTVVSNPATWMMVPVEN